MIRFENDLGTRSEQRLLAALMRQPSCIRYVRHVTPRDFAHGIHGEVFRAIRALIESGDKVCIANVLARINARVCPIPMGWPTYVVTLSCSEGTPANADIYAAFMVAHNKHHGRPA